MSSGDSARVLVIGGGPAGLRAAEVARASGASVILCDAQASVGRKFLVAGRGGLNLTHSESVENFPARYRAETERWQDLLGEFGRDDLRAWAGSLGFETYVGSSGRVFPQGQKAAGLLRAWVRQLREAGVEFRMGCELRALVDMREHVPPEGRASARPDAGAWRADFRTADDGNVSLGASAVVLALGGASWPETGSNGAWPAMLKEFGVEIAPWQPANCGWEVDWPDEFLARAEGLPLKNLTVTAGGESVSGELLITRYGLEGGALYRLGPVLRAMAQPALELDLKPQLSAKTVGERLTSGGLKLSPAAQALLDCFPDSEIKHFRLQLRGPRPIAEAISSAGGIAWSEIDRNLMLPKMPGIFVAGEMIDWEAPTGGYLLQGCFATGTRAGQSAAEFTLASAR